MPELKQRDFVTWRDVDTMLDHMRKEHGLVGTVEYFRATNRKGQDVSKVGISWHKTGDSYKDVALLSAAIEWPCNSWKSIPALLLFVAHRDEDLWLRKVAGYYTAQEPLPF